MANLLLIGLAALAGWAATAYARAARDEERAEYERRYGDTYPGPM